MYGSSGRIATPNVEIAEGEGEFFGWHASGDLFRVLPGRNEEFVGVRQIGTIGVHSCCAVYLEFRAQRKCFLAHVNAWDPRARDQEDISDASRAVIRDQAMQHVYAACRQNRCRPADLTYGLTIAPYPRGPGGAVRDGIERFFGRILDRREHAPRFVSNGFDLVGGGAGLVVQPSTRQIDYRPDVTDQVPGYRSVRSSTLRPYYWSYEVGNGWFGAPEEDDDFF